MVVVGDTLLDRDVDGAVERLCPDAPAPVLNERSALERPGGAGLAAVLAARYGGDVVLVTALADDAGGACLSELLSAAGVKVYALPMRGATPEKVRLRADGRVMLRLDRGGAPGAVGEAPDAALAALRDATAILVSDYGRGLVRQPDLRAALGRASAPVVWDPHPRGPAPVPGVRLATPNEAEVRRLASAGSSGSEVDGGSRIAVATAGAQELRRRWRAGAVAVTMGADGALLCHAGPTPLVVPASVVDGGDACGAGDSFAAAVTVALAGGELMSRAVEQAVRDATAYVSSSLLSSSSPRPSPGGVGRDAAGEVLSRVRAAGGQVVATGGCFDLLHAGHVATLEAARRLGDCLVVCLNSDASVRGLKGPERPVVGEADRARLLAALGCVDAVVVFDESTPEAVLTWLRPDVWVKGGDYGSDAAELPEADLMRRWGGQAVLVPYLDGRSTSTMIAAAREGAR
ncbi:PfkB family carbohydrate kinase [Micromonospora sp. CPCC 206061]|uniref:PfkB family carbohydrate kinase n=1 Tax=Micromonospora sp. CPCC 206061 TaxID=3122410 RepID=UPI002FEE9565